MGLPRQIPQLPCRCGVQREPLRSQHAQYFIGGTMSSVYKGEIDGISGLTGGASGRKTGSCQNSSARSAHSLGEICCWRYMGV